MHILTRAEEEYLFKTLKANALKECDPVVKGALGIDSHKTGQDCSGSITFGSGSVSLKCPLTFCSAV